MGLLCFCKFSAWPPGNTWHPVCYVQSVGARTYQWLTIQMPISTNGAPQSYIKWGLQSSTPRPSEGWTPFISVSSGANSISTILRLRCSAYFCSRINEAEISKLLFWSFYSFQLIFLFKSTWDIFFFLLHNRIYQSPLPGHNDTGSLWLNIPPG